MKFKNTIFSVMVATCLPNLALADDNKSFNLKLDEITVTATKTPIKIEEVPITTTYAFDSNLVDMSAVEKIEILKGPQRTMHGGRAISGGHKCYYEKRRQRESVFGYKNRL